VESRKAGMAVESREAPLFIVKPVTWTSKSRSWGETGTERAFGVNLERS
jgi:hypothetical protein